MQMIYLFILAGCFFSVLNANCSKYNNKDDCLKNCFCGWKTDPYQKVEKTCVDVCYPINGVQCEINESTFCDVIFVLFRLNQLLFGLVMVCIVIVLILGGFFMVSMAFGAFFEIVKGAYQKYVVARYVVWMVGGALCCGLSVGFIYILCNIILMSYTAFLS